MQHNQENIIDHSGMCNIVKKYHRSFIFAVYYIYHINKVYLLIKKLSSTEHVHAVIKVVYYRPYESIKRCFH